MKLLAQQRTTLCGFLSTLLLLRRNNFFSRKKNLELSLFYWIKENCCCTVKEWIFVSGWPESGWWFQKITNVFEMWNHWQLIVFEPNRKIMKNLRRGLRSVARAGVKTGLAISLAKLNQQNFILLKLISLESVTINRQRLFRLTEWRFNPIEFFGIA